MSNSKKITIFVSLLLVLLLSIYVFFANERGIWPFSKKDTPTSISNLIDYTKPSSEQAEAGAAVKENIANEQTNQKSTSDTSVPVEITSVNTSGSTLLVRAIVHTVSDSGSCKLSIQQNGVVIYSDEANLQALAGSSSCKGFNVPLSSLKSGKHMVTVKYSNGASTGEASREISL